MNKTFKIEIYNGFTGLTIKGLPEDQAINMRFINSIMLYRHYTRGDFDNVASYRIVFDLKKL